MTDPNVSYKDRIARLLPDGYMQANKNELRSISAKTTNEDAQDESRVDPTGLASELAGLACRKMAGAGC